MIYQLYRTHFKYEGELILQLTVFIFSIRGNRTRRIMKGDVLMNGVITDLAHMSHTMTL